MRERAVEPLMVLFEKPNPGGAYNPVEIPGMRMESAASVPAVGDYVYDVTSGDLPVPYRVSSRHYTPAHNQVIVIIEEVENVENCPFI